MGRSGELAPFDGFVRVSVRPGTVLSVTSDGSQGRNVLMKGGKAKVWLAPPIIAPKDDKGYPKKIEFGGWMLELGFPVLARLKG